MMYSYTPIHGDTSNLMYHPGSAVTAHPGVSHQPRRRGTRHTPARASPRGRHGRTRRPRATPAAPATSRRRARPSNASSNKRAPARPHVHATPTQATPQPHHAHGGLRERRRARAMRATPAHSAGARAAAARAAAGLTTPPRAGPLARARRGDTATSASTPLPGRATAAEPRATRAVRQHGLPIPAPHRETTR